MAFESDDEKRSLSRTGSDGGRGAPDAEAGRASSEPSDGLGALSADLPGAERGEESDDAIDSAALAALSKAQPSTRPPGTEDADGSRVQLAGASALATDRASSRPPPAPTSPVTPAMSLQPSAAGRWIVPLIIGFALGVPAGGLLWSDQSPISSPALGSDNAPSAAQPRARAADETAAAVGSPIRAPAAPRVPLAESGESPRSAAAAVELAEPATARLPVIKPAEPPASSAAAHTLKAAPAAVKLAPAAPGPAADLAPAATAPVAAAPPPAAKNRSVDQLLDDALASSTERKVQEHADRVLAPSPGLALAPSRDEVTRAMTVLLPAIRGCAAGQSGLATVGIVVRNDGRVESVAVTGAPFEGERSGRCMEGVVRHAKFPRFQQRSFRVQFPFALQ